MLPELTANQQYCGQQADLWATGVVLYAMLTGQLPFRGKNLKELYKKIQKGAYLKPTDSNAHPISLSARDLIGKLLCMEPSKRIDADEALSHPWFQNN
jgi:serine/threonine protein kinase